jgi:hypothetical protein
MSVFLSYDSRDSRFAEQLTSRLAAENLDVWDPARELYPASNWLLESGRALERADGIVFLISKNSAQSPALRREVEYAITNVRFKDRVVPIVLSRGVKNIPWILETMGVIDAADHDMDRVAKLVATAMHRSETKSPTARRVAARTVRSKAAASRTSKTRH